MGMKKGFAGLGVDQSDESKTEVKKLAVLDEDDKNTIFHLIFDDKPEKKSETAK